MFSRAITGGLAAAAVGAAMLAISTTSASALTISQPSLAPAVAGADIQKVWWDRWGRWHPNHPYYWGGSYYYRPYYHRHCWRNAWGYVRCGW